MVPNQVHLMWPLNENFIEDQIPVISHVGLELWAYKPGMWALRLVIPKHPNSVTFLNICNSLCHVRMDVLTLPSV